MIDKHAIRAEELVEEGATIGGSGGVANLDSKHDRRVCLKRLDEYTLILTIHQQQTQEVLDCLNSRGIEVYPEEEPSSSLSGYGLLYIPTLNPEFDIIAYQKVLDDVD